MATPVPGVAQADYETLAGFRRALRAFLHFSASAARAAGLSPAQHQALLAIKGSPEGAPPTVGELAAQLCLRHHSAVGLVDRLARRRFVRRLSDPRDARLVRVGLTPGAEALLGRLSAAHRQELRRIRPELRRLLDNL